MGLLLTSGELNRSTSSLLRLAWSIALDRPTPLTCPSERNMNTKPVAIAAWLPGRNVGKILPSRNSGYARSTWFMIPTVRENPLIGFNVKTQAYLPRVAVNRPENPQPMGTMAAPEVSEWFDRACSTYLSIEAKSVSLGSSSPGETSTPLDPGNRH